MVWSLTIQNTLKDIFSITFSSNDWKRMNMYFEGLFISLHGMGRPL